MRHTFFDVRNFKGVRKARLDLTGRPQSRIFTLVGLNESGKTTLLEALNFIEYKPESLDTLELAGYAVTDAHDLIPINARSNFNAAISVEAGFETDEEDEDNIREFLLANYQFRLTNGVEKFSIKQQYKFQNSKVATGPRYLWTISLVGRVKGARRDRMLDASDPIWLGAVKHIATLLPGVLYFPNFLFEFPDRIYLESLPEQPPKYEYYRTVLQDVLDSVGEDIDLETHVLARAKSNDRADKQALESVLLKMGANLTENIFAQWNKIFRRKQGRKEVSVECDKDESGRWYIRLRIRDGHELYAVTERSLGFRWFFAFLLFTVYRGFRTRETRSVLFLLDEPASNLHPSAQAQLLQSFDKLPANCSLVYTTHSHHMINPDWLESAYVVVNEGMHYDDDDDYTASKTAVTLHKYRTFASQHPNRTTYFQPILDVLQYSPTRLDNIPDVIMLEGKHDYYALTYFQTLVPRTKFHLLPGNGAGSLKEVIRLYFAWGRNFLVLLDSDDAGTSEHGRYLDTFGEGVRNRLFTLADVNTAWTGRSLEFILQEADRMVIQNAVYPSDTAFAKTHFGRAVQELFLTKNRVKISTDSLRALEELFRFFAEHLAAGAK